MKQAAIENSEMNRPAPIGRRQAAFALFLAAAGPRLLLAQLPAEQREISPFERTALDHLKLKKPVQEVKVNTSPNDTAVAEIPLGEALGTFENVRFYAFRVRVPQKAGHMVWAFEHTRDIHGFLVLRERDGSKPAAKSNLIKGLFERNRPEVFDARLGQDMPSYASYRILRVPGRELQPGETLVVWYAVTEGIKTIRQSANVFPYQTYMPHRHLFPELGLEHPQE